MWSFATRSRVIAAFCLLVWGGGLPAAVRGDPLASATEAQSLLDAVTTDAVKTFGFALGYRAYEPATSLFSAGRRMDLSLDVTLVRFPDDFKNSLASSGFGTVSLGFLPAAKASMVLGMGPTMDFGVSAFYYPNLITTIGGGPKFVLLQPEQGLTLALRMTYTYTYMVGAGVVSGADLYFKTHTADVEFIASRKLHFADPYIGLGYQYALGTVIVPFEVAPGIVLEQTATGQGGQFHAFLGVGFVIGPSSGLKLTLEGSYSQYNAHTLGTKLGFTF